MGAKSTANPSVLIGLMLHDLSHLATTLDKCQSAELIHAVGRWVTVHRMPGMPSLNPLADVSPFEGSESDE